VSVIREGEEDSLNHTYADLCTSLHDISLTCTHSLPHTYLHIHTHTHSDTYIHTHVHVHTQTYIYIRTYVHTYRV
jgi:hypothetical protein